MYTRAPKIFQKSRSHLRILGALWVWGLGLSPFSPDKPSPLDGSFVPHSPMSREPCSFTEVPDDHQTWTLNNLWVQKERPKCTCLSKARALHSHKTWIEVVPSFTPYNLCKGLQLSPIRCRCHLGVLCPVRWPVTTLDCVLLKDKVRS